MVPAVVSKTGLSMAGGAPGARGGGSCASNEPEMTTAIVTTARGLTLVTGTDLPILHDAPDCAIPMDGEAGEARVLAERGLRSADFRLELAA